MKLRLGNASLFIFVFCLIHVLSPQLAAQNRDRNSRIQNGACFYMDENYGGDTFCLNAGEERQELDGRFNDRISSIRIFGQAQVVVYEHRNFGGASKSFRGDASNLQDWNDKITAIRVQSTGSRDEHSGFRGNANEPRNGACFYVDADYRGDRFCFNSNESQPYLRDRLNDRISSIRIFGRAEVTVFGEPNFNGPRRTFRQDVPNMSIWNDRISSFRIDSPQEEGRFGNERRGREPRNGACFYLDENYGGDSFCLNAGESLRNVGDRYNDQISSIRVFGKVRVIVHEHDNFGGASRVILDNVPNLRDFNDIITSVEVR
jgi:hypothetical protein